MVACRHAPCAQSRAPWALISQHRPGCQVVDASPFDSSHHHMHERTVGVCRMCAEWCTKREEVHRDTQRAERVQGAARAAADLVWTAALPGPVSIQPPSASVIVRHARAYLTPSQPCRTLPCPRAHLRPRRPRHNPLISVLRDCSIRPHSHFARGDTSRREAAVAVRSPPC